MGWSCVTGNQASKFTVQLQFWQLLQQADTQYIHVVQHRHIVHCTHTHTWHNSHNIAGVSLFCFLYCMYTMKLSENTVIRKDSCDHALSIAISIVF